MSATHPKGNSDFGDTSKFFNWPATNIHVTLKNRIHDFLTDGILNSGVASKFSFFLKTKVQLFLIFETWQ